ncbi:MAG: hypothetical protein E7508_02190 [Ruminococcus sp.]|nr:hypothetical protein [Ruminococcus sp.]
MQIVVRDDKRIAEIWLTSAEQQEENVQDFIGEKTAEYSKMKYKVAVFRSGSRSLYDCTDGLLHNNYCLGEGA